MFIEEENDDALGIEKARIYITNQKKLIEDTKKTNTNRLLPVEMNLEQARDNTAQKIATMTNNVEAVYYKEDNLISTIERGEKLASLIEESKSISSFSSQSKETKRSRVFNPSQFDERSVASSITWETILFK